MEILKIAQQARELAQHYVFPKCVWVNFVTDFKKGTDTLSILVTFEQGDLQLSACGASSSSSAHYGISEALKDLEDNLVEKSGYPDKGITRPVLKPNRYPLF